MMIRRFILLLLSTGFVGMLDAQLDKVQELAYESGFSLKLELYGQAGISLPLGAYAKLADESGKQSATQLGAYGELVATHRLRKTPLWGVQLVMGYMQHSVQEEKVKSDYDLLLFEAKAWQMGYLMPGIEFQGGRSFKFALGLSAGMLLYSGWNASKGAYYKGMMELKEWSFGWRITGALRASLMLGYKVTKRCFIYVQTAWFYGAGARSGQLNKGLYRFDAQTGNRLNPPVNSETLTVLHTTIIHTLNIGLGLRYQFYNYLHDPNAGLDGAIRVY